MIINRRTILMVVVFIVSSITLIWLVPRFFALYHQVEGGILLAEKLEGRLNDSSLPCSAEPLTDDAMRAQVVKAADHLQTALKYNPSLAKANLLLGRAYCWLGELKESIKYYEIYTQMKPNNPLGHLELALASQIQLIQLPGTGDVEGADSISGQDLKNTALTEWSLTDVKPEQIVVSGNHAYSEGEYSNAVVWYSAASSVLADKSILSSSLFRWGIANIMSGSSELPESSESSILVHNLDESILIQGEDLQWNRSAPNWDLDYGDMLNKFPSSDSEVGVMWWQGAAIALVQVSESGNYQIDIRVQENQNDPISFQMERNFTPLEKFTTSGGDQSWYEFETHTSLSSGLNIIGVNLLKDTGDLGIDWIRINKIYKPRGGT